MANDTVPAASVDRLPRMKQVGFLSTEDGTGVVLRIADESGEHFSTMTPEGLSGVIGLAVQAAERIGAARMSPSTILVSSEPSAVIDITEVSSTQDSVTLAVRTGGISMLYSVPKYLLAKLAQR